MTAMVRRLTHLESLRLPQSRKSRPDHDLTRLTSDQRLRYDELNVRFASVGLEGLTDAELDEIIDLVAIVEVDAQP